MRITKDTLARRIGQALGRDRADVVVKGTRFLNVATGGIDRGDIAISGDTIVGIHEEYQGTTEIDGHDAIVVPGFIDSHVHVESALLAPAEFERCVLVRGTTTAVCDPHEICNVLGLAGLRYMLESAANLAMDLRVKLSSCVPATDLETAGARLGVDDLVPFLDHPGVIGLAEMMNFPGVLAGDGEGLAKLAAFAATHIDGHAPLVRGYDLNAYLAAGVRTCHESTTTDEAAEKLAKGMHVLIREGSLSKDTAALAPLLSEATWPFVSFCTDDRNPLDIMEAGHIDHCIREAIAAGAPMAPVYRAATWGAARAFGFHDRGIVAPGYRADLVLLDDLETCSVGRVIQGGQIVDDALFRARRPVEPIGRGSVDLDRVGVEDFAVPATVAAGPVIGIVPGTMLTERLAPAGPADPANDIQKVCVFARHGINRNIGRGFVKGFGLRGGALASSVGHDSHNVIVTGSDDTSMAAAVNRIIELDGGFVAVGGGRVVAELALPIAGLMSMLPAAEVGRRLKDLRRAAHGLGSALDEPFLQLAFLALPVIPHLKITDRGLVDVDRFELLAG